MATNWTKAHKAAKQKVMAVQSNPTVVGSFSLKDFGALCEAIEAAYPDLVPNIDAVASAGVGKNGEPIKMALYARPANKAEGLKAANVTLYGSGKAVWCNLAPVSL